MKVTALINRLHEATELEVFFSCSNILNKHTFYESTIKIDHQVIGKT